MTTIQKLRLLTMFRGLTKSISKNDKIAAYRYIEMIEKEIGLIGGEEDGRTD